MEEKNKDIVIDGQQETLLFQDVCSIIEHGRQQAYGSVSHIAIATYWNVGKRIVEEEQNGEKRAAYGIGLMKNLSESLVPVYGRNYSKRNLDYYKKFYLLFPEPEKVNTCVHNLECIGQLDMYVRMYDDLVKGEDDQPTVGVLLCTDTDNTIARYSVLNDSDQLYAAKYMTYMPTEEELRREIEQQKEFYRLQHKEDKDDGR